MSRILITMAEERDKTTANHFAVRYPVDEYDCYDFSNGLQELGHTVYFVNWSDLYDGFFTRIFCDNEKKFVEHVALDDIDLAFVYKMEGFLFDLPRFFNMVSTFEKRCGRVVNHPDTIRHNIDKRYLFELQADGILITPTWLVDDRVKDSVSPDYPMVLKPMIAERGFGAILAKSPEDFEQIKGQHDKYLAQQYRPEIRAGEKSLVFLGFDFQHAVLKTPNPAKADEFRCNESLGGSVAIYEPTKEELAFCTRLLEVYQSLGYEVHFSRIDFITTSEGPMLIEAELLNPSIYANYSKKGPEFGRAIAQYFNMLLAVRTGSQSSVT